MPRRLSEEAGVVPFIFVVQANARGHGCEIRVVSLQPGP